MFLIYEQEDHVVTITLNRPEVLNAVNAQLKLELRAAWERIDQDDTAWVTIITGAGNRAFCVGRDIKDRVAKEEHGAFVGATAPQDIPPVYTETRKPVIAAINGLCVGGGLNLAIGCDIRIASDRAKFGLPETRVGMAPLGGMDLPRLMHTSTAMYLLLTGETIDAEEALRTGLVSKVVPAQELMPAAKKIADSICRGSPFLVQMTRQAAWARWDMTAQEYDSYAAKLRAIAFASEDHREGGRAFVEKRAPVWKGK